MGVAFSAGGHAYVWSKGGVVWRFERGERVQPPVIDIREETATWGDHGLIGFALDPDFTANGYVYLLYVVDYHYLRFFGTALYDPHEDWPYRDTIARVARYRLRAEDDFRSVEPGSRQVLIGESISTGIPIVVSVHGIGGLAFGADGTLLVATGDSGSFQGVDAGGPNGLSSNTALRDGIMRAAEDVGAFRAQLVDSHCGKILRVDPATGNGLPSNPFFEPAAPRAPRSRVWALGLRMPFRVSVRPGTGSADPADGEPGSIYIGNVGWERFEEIHVCRRGGENFGWPLYEGMDIHPQYYAAEAYNLDAPNPLFGVGGCKEPYFAFRDLIIQDTLDPNPWFPNPCDPSRQLPGDVARFVHRRPAIDWGNPNGPARSATWTDGNPTWALIGAARSPVEGQQFAGACSIGGAWYVGDNFPPSYWGTYFHADFSARWIRNFVFDADDRPTAVREFVEDGLARTICLAVDPADGSLCRMDYGDLGQCTVRRIRRVSNVPPTAVARADVAYGPTPLTVNFDASLSYDSEDGGLSALTYEWDFGDGTPPSTEMMPVHVYLPDPAAGSPGPVRRNVRLTVRDSDGESAVAQLHVSLDNTPPVVHILSPADGDHYPLTGQSTYPLVAHIEDAEHDPGELSCRWQTILHHNKHTHADPPDLTCQSTTTTVLPIGCDGEVYYYEINFTVDDPAGLSTTQSVFLYPDCDSAPSVPPDCTKGDHGHFCAPPPEEPPPPDDSSLPGRADLPCGGGLCGIGSGGALIGLAFMRLISRRARRHRRWRVPASDRETPDTFHL